MSFDVWTDDYKKSLDIIGAVLMIAFIVSGVSYIGVAIGDWYHKRRREKRRKGAPVRRKGADK